MSQSKCALAIILLAAHFAWTSRALAQTFPSTPPAFYAWAPTPPMGWNSYDAFGDSVTEAEVLQNAQFMKDQLFDAGYHYVVIDYRWYDPKAKSLPSTAKDRVAPILTADSFGRMIPAANRFPSSVSANGFKPLADKIHAMGLQFGLHMMRGIPRQSAKAKTPIEGSTFTADQAADPTDTCKWCSDMYGVKNTAAGQAWYDSTLRLYASWDLDFIKIDDLSAPYHAHEIEMIRRAIDRCGRPIVFSTSPGRTPVKQASHISANANMWRISSDMWDKWKSLDEKFDLLSNWKDVGGPGHWPDADMIPLGHLGIRCDAANGNHLTHFTRDEQTTLMTFWGIAPSPLILGMNLPDLDPWTLKLVTNKDLLAIDQDPLGIPAQRVLSTKDGQEIWTRDLAHDVKVVALFNRGPKDQDITLHPDQIGLIGNYKVFDVWSGKDVSPLNSAPVTFSIPTHGALLLRLSR